jgi:protein phosphatase
MSPAKASGQPDFLEYPDEAFDYYRSERIARVVCEEKHMGSRAVIVLCRDEQAALNRFGIDGVGAVYTRTGRPMFESFELEKAVLSKLTSAAESGGLWRLLETGWVVLDCELMPWSAKAQRLIRGQYAAVGAAARAALDAEIKALRMAMRRLPEAEPLLTEVETRRKLIDRYVDAYRSYCWPVDGVDDLRIAPFHLLASESGVHVDRDHAWHLEQLSALAAARSDLLVATAHRLVNLDDEAAAAEATAWWCDLTERGGEGMVVKPRDFIAQGRRGTVQPAIKCRGREYLRIIYGPDYTEAGNLNRLRTRGLAKKRSLAYREFSLGIEGLERFARREPLRRVHECAFAVLALESEPVDPRL